MTSKRLEKLILSMYFGNLELYKSYDKNYFSKDFVMNMLNLNKNSIRKYNINKIFNDKTREI
jgi:hypothetical protein